MTQPRFLAPRGPRPLGRATDLTIAHWPTIVRAMPVAPTIVRGELPRKSPAMWRFINPRIHHQIIGMCVGRGCTRMAECLIRIPDGATQDAEPGPAVDLSSLFTYWIARRYSIDHGINFGGEGADNNSAGAIVSHAILALHGRGYIPRMLWDDADPRAEVAYRDSRTPAPADFEAGLLHTVKDYAILDSREKILQYLSMGYPVAQGVNITQGWMQTDDAGHFRHAGSFIGGHCTCLIGYDMDEGWVAILNSWPQWGRRSTEPQFRDAEGYTNIGYLPMEDFDRMFTPQLMASGDSEAVVANNVAGFDRPKIAFDFTNWYGTASKPA